METKQLSSEQKETGTLLRSGNSGLSAYGFKAYSNVCSSLSYMGEISGIDTINFYYLYYSQPLHVFGAM